MLLLARETAYKMMNVESWICRIRLSYGDTTAVVNLF